jgi:N-acyl-D-amino-acid deacylase
MQANIRLSTLLAVASLTVCGCGPGPDNPTSTLISNAIVIDGTGGPGISASVRIHDDRIVSVGQLEPLPSEAVIDANGMVLAPGFIDTHSHHDYNISEYRHMPGVLTQGITTIVRGADGSSGSEDAYGYISQAEFSQAFAEQPAAVNVASFSPHGDIRFAAMGDDFKREATAAEVEAMSNLVEADMRAGAIGLGSGLEYEPGIHSSTEEVIALAKVASRHGGGYMSHLRDEDDRFMDALGEIIRIGREADLPVQVSHIKLADKMYWGSTANVIDKLEAARKDGVMISADIYPYLRWQSNLAILFPDRDFTNEEAAVFTFERTSAPEDIVISRYMPNRDFDGMTVAEIARVTERDPVTTLLELTQAADRYLQETGQGGVSIIAKGMDENDIIDLMRWRFTNICSDGGHGGGHPRGYGAFPRVLRRYVRELGVMSLEEAIHKMSGLAADAMNLKLRGRIFAGNYADLVLFDPDTIADRSTMDDPTAASVGVINVWVNGELVFANNESTGVYSGRIVTLADADGVSK